MPDGTVGVQQSAAPNRLIDNETVVNDAAASVYRQKVTLADDFAYLTRTLRGYALAVETTIALAAETDWLLFKNTSATKLIRLFEHVTCLPGETNSVRSIFRIYKNPTVTLNGTAATVSALRNGQAATVAQAFTLPTIAARGTKVQVYGVNFSPVIRALNNTRYVEPLDSLLVTVQPSGTGLLHSFDQAWAEVDP